MKKILLILFVSVLLFSCNDDKEIRFDADLSSLAISFIPYEGGAYMNYTLPPNADIYGIQAKYKDWTGKEMLVKGTHANDQLILFGFSSAQDEVPVEIALIDHEGNLSESLNKSFSTLNSVPFGIFDELEVNPHWNGFRVSYPELTGNVEGFMHIYFVGINPQTQKMDTLPVSNLPILESGYDFLYTGIEKEKNLQELTVVIKTEDNRGNEVRKEIYNKVPIAIAEQFPSDQIGFEGSTVEDPVKKYSWTYLFDGDVKGEECFLAGYAFKYFSYKSEPGAEFDDEKNVITLDLQEQKEIAWLRLYTNIAAKIKREDNGMLWYMKFDYQFYHPSHVIVYGTNDKDAPEEEWIKFDEYKEFAEIERTQRWSYPAYDEEKFFTIAEIDLFRDAEPNYLQFDCEITGDKYRYLKIKIKETFRVLSYGRTGEFGMEELEVFVRQ